MVLRCEGGLLLEAALSASLERGPDLQQVILNLMLCGYVLRNTAIEVSNLLKVFRSRPN